MQKFDTGRSIPIEEKQLDMVLQHPVWEYAYNEESRGSHAKTWQRPLLDIKEVTNEIFNPIILLEVENHDFYATADFDNTVEGLNHIRIWKDNRWIDLEICEAIEQPVVFKSIPKLFGVDNVRFVCYDKQEGLAEKLI